MAWTSVNPVVVGGATRKSDFDAVFDNTIWLDGVLKGTNDLGSNWLVGSSRQLQIGDTSFYLDLAAGGAGVPGISFDGTGVDRLDYVRATNAWRFIVASGIEAQVDASGLQVADGLNVGFLAAPTAATVKIGAASFYASYNAGNPVLLFDNTGTNDYQQFTRATNLLEWLIADAVRFQVNANGVGLFDGTVSLPGLYFISDTNTGFHRSTTDTIDVIAGAASVASFNGSGLGLIDGSAATPGLFQRTTPSTGVFFGTNIMGFAVNGLEVFRFSSDGSTIAYWEMTEVSADAAAPAANKVRVWARDSGGGKTQLVARFATGAIQVVSAEP